jgi:hypothetical protein
MVSNQTVTAALRALSQAALGKGSMAGKTLPRSDFFQLLAELEATSN